MSFDQLRDRVEQRIIDYARSRHADTVLSEEALQLLTELQVDHSAEADDGASQAKECFVDVVADLPADA